MCPSGATNAQCKHAQRVGWVHNRHRIHAIITCSGYDMSDVHGWVYNRHHINAIITCSRYDIADAPGWVQTTKRRKTKQKDNTICVGHYITEWHTHNVNKTRASYKQLEVILVLYFSLSCPDGEYSPPVKRYCINLYRLHLTKGALVKWKIYIVHCCIYLTTYDWIKSFLKITIELRRQSHIWKSTK